LQLAVRVNIHVCN